MSPPIKNKAFPTGSSPTQNNIQDGHFCIVVFPTPRWSLRAAGYLHRYTAAFQPAGTVGVTVLELEKTPKRIPYWGVFVVVATIGLTLAFLFV